VTLNSPTDAPRFAADGCADAGWCLLECDDHRGGAMVSGGGAELSVTVAAPALHPIARRRGAAVRPDGADRFIACSSSAQQQLPPLTPMPTGVTTRPPVAQWTVRDPSDELEVTVEVQDSQPGHDGACGDGHRGGWTVRGVGPRPLDVTRGCVPSSVVGAVGSLAGEPSEEDRTRQARRAPRGTDDRVPCGLCSGLGQPEGMLMLKQALAAAALMLLVCSALAMLLVLLGLGPWQRWLVPTLLISSAWAVATVVRAPRRPRGGATPT
jgi:hypothetical protein